MGSSYSAPSPESESQILQAYTQQLPGLLNLTSQQDTNVADNQLSATQATQPAYNQLNLNQAQQFALPLAQVGQQVVNSNAQAGANTNLQQLQGAGGQVANAALGLAQQTNPNYYNVQNPASAQASNLLGAYNTTGLSSGAANAAERSTNQSNVASGNLGLSNPTNTIANAMDFGQAYQQQLAGLNTALGSAATTATSAQNTGFNPVSLALGQPNSSTMGNFGTGTYSPTSALTQNSASSNALGFGQSLLGNMSSTNNAAIGANAQLGSSQIAGQYGLGSSALGSL